MAVKTRLISSYSGSLFLGLLLLCFGKTLSACISVEARCLRVSHYILADVKDLTGQEQHVFRLIVCDLYIVQLLVVFSSVHFGGAGRSRLLCLLHAVSHGWWLAHLVLNNWGYNELGLLLATQPFTALNLFVMVSGHFKFPDYLVWHSNSVEQLIIVKQLAVAHDLDAMLLKDAQLMLLFAFLDARG